MSETTYGCRLLQTGTLDLDSGQLRRADGQLVKLTRLELKLLRYLDARAGVVVSAEELHAEVWGHASRVVSRAVDNTASRLRKKIEPADGPPVHLRRIPGEGFVFALSPVEVSPQEPPPEAFFGRAGEAAALEALLAASPLVEVLGPGGIGKTRLVQEVLRRASLPRAIWVDLSAVTEEGGLRGALAEAIGVPSDRLDALLPTLADALVVLDNAEQIIELVRARLQAWRGGLRWLVTSRRALRLRGVRTLRLGPLDAPSATAMLRDRAGSRRRGWGERERDTPQLAALVSLLEGWPLAVELAASRAALLTPASMLRQLHRAPARAPGGEDRPERHTSLARTLEWSWSLMPAADQQALARLSVFQRSFSIEAALAVLGDDAGLDSLERLVDHSMIAPYDSAGDTPRLCMLVTIRRFAAEALGEDERLDAARRAAGAFSVLYSEDVFRDFSQSTPEGDELRTQVREERDNLIAAMRRLLDDGRDEEGMWLARVVLEDLTLQKDNARLAELAADAMARRSGAAETSQDLAVAMLRGFALTRTGAHDQGHALLKAVAAQAEAAGRPVFAHSAHYMRLTALMAGWQAAPLAEAAEAARRVILEGGSNPVWIDRVDCMQGGWEARYAELEPRGRARLEALLERLPVHQHAFLHIYTLIGLSTAALTRDQPVEAERLARRAAQAIQEAGQRWPFGELLLARALLRQGRPGDAQARLEPLARRLQADQLRELPEARLLLSRAHFDQDDRTRAAALLTQTGEDLLRHPYDKTRAQWHVERARQAASPALAAEQLACAWSLIPDGAPVPANIFLGGPRSEPSLRLVSGAGQPVATS